LKAKDQTIDLTDSEKKMIEKIISGGQSEVDRAALDFALKFNIPHGGWIPKKRL